MDDELVNKTLSFLDAGSDQHFKEALRYYEGNKPVKSAESLRRSLEEFLRYKLENKQGLKKNIGNLQDRTKDSSPPEIRNIIFSTVNNLEQIL